MAAGDRSGLDTRSVLTPEEYADACASLRGKEPPPRVTITLDVAEDCALSVSCESLRLTATCKPGASSRAVHALSETLSAAGLHGMLRVKEPEHG